MLYIKFPLLFTVVSIIKEDSYTLRNIITKSNSDKRIYWIICSEDLSYHVNCKLHVLESLTTVLVVTDHWTRLVHPVIVLAPGLRERGKAPPENLSLSQEPSIHT